MAFSRNIALLCCSATLMLGNAAHAQSSPSADQSANWRTANDLAGKNLRGHIDILRAEQVKEKASISQSGKAVNRPKGSSAGLSLDESKRIALANRPDLFAKGSESVAERIALQSSTTQFLMQVERAWMDAVSQALLLQKQEQSTEAADIAYELALRMQKVGNWPKDRVLGIGQEAINEQIKLIQARQSALEAKKQLSMLLMVEQFELPTSLPDIRGIGSRDDLRRDATTLAMERLDRLPNYASSILSLAKREQAIGETTLSGWSQYAQASAATAVSQQNLQALAIDRSKLLWNHDIEKVLMERNELASVRLDNITTMMIAQHTVRARHAEVMAIVNQSLPLALESEEEAVYRYNGMFISTWDLLNIVRQRIATEMALIDSQARYWEAEYAFKAYLSGAPYVAPGAPRNPGAGTSAPGKGH